MKKTQAEICAQYAAQGHEHLRAGEYDAALGIAQELRQLRYSASFEIAALAHAGQGRIERAVDELEQGVGLAPDVWLNWSLLGNYRSDLGRYAEAEAAYARALVCPGVDRDVVQLNRAILANRLGEHATSQELLDDVAAPEHGQRVARARVLALVGLGRDDEAERIALGLLCSSSDAAGISGADPRDDEEEDQAEGWLAAEVAKVRLRRGIDREEVRAFLAESLFGTRGHDAQLALIRDIDGEYSADAKYYRVNLHATAPEGVALPDGIGGYLSSIDVVADSPDEALGYIRRVQVIEPFTQWVLNTCSVLESRPSDPKGVYRLEGCTWYGVNLGE